MMRVMKPRKTNTLTVVIHKPVHEVFTFLLDPENTSRWIDSIISEETNGWPVKEGTVYRNKNREGVWHEYVVTSLEIDTYFIFRMKDGNYHVMYTFAAVSDKITEVEYKEWVIRGALADPFTQEILGKLKTTLETS